MPAQLLALTEGPNILLDKPILLLGRHPECDIQIESRKVSRRHCCIAQVHDYLVVRDLGSTNGIRINGVRVLEGRLGPGDELTIGSHRYEVRWDMMAARPGRSKEPPAKGSTRRRTDLHRPADASLESFDEPVPLPEPSQPSSGSVPKALPSPPAGAGPAPAAAADMSDKESPSPILPEKLDLAPVSDILPPVAGQPGPSP
ncbi:MAG TPA: FHA domain-containing protein [Gemmataceae bacterium]|nr:FHA domain-containing protein [Gemmataceae bacterium]